MAKLCPYCDYGAISNWLLQGLSTHTHTHTHIAIMKWSCINAGENEQAPVFTLFSA